MRHDNHWGQDLARRLGISGSVERLDSRAGATLHIPCAGKSGKEHIVDVKISPNLDPNGTAKMMLNKGWTLGRRRIFCPDCGKRKKTPREKVERTEMPLPIISPEVTPKPAVVRDLGRMPPHLAKFQSQVSPEQRRAWGLKGGELRNRVTTPEQRREWGRKGGLTKEANRLKREEERLKQEGRIPAAPCPTLKETKIMADQERGTAAPTASDPARAAKRAVMQWLDEAFNVEKGTYQAGVSDATIAKETGVAETKIKALREEFYGPLGEPDELREMKAKLIAVEAAYLEAARVFDQEVARIKRRFDALCNKMGWALI